MIINLIKIFFLSVILMGNAVAADLEVHSGENAIISVKLHNPGEPDGFRGLAFDINLDRVLDEQSEVRYELDFVSKSGFRFQVSGNLTTPITYDQPTKKWRKNLYLNLPYHSAREDAEEDQYRKDVKQEILPGNIEKVRVKVIENEIGWFSSKEKILSDVTYYDL